MSIRVKQRSMDSIMIRCSNKQECDFMMYLLADFKNKYPTLNITLKTQNNETFQIPKQESIPLASGQNIKKDINTEEIKY